MTDAPEKTPLRMTAQEFVTCLAVMAGAAKVSSKPPKPPKYIELSRTPIEGKFRWIEGKDIEGNFKRIKAPVHAITVTRVNLTKKYPHCSKRQQRRYAMQEGNRLRKLFLAGKITVDDVRDGVGLPRVAVGGDNYFAISN